MRSFRLPPLDKGYYKNLTEAHRIARRLAALDRLDDVEQFAPQVLAIMQGVSGTVWVLLDEKPGLFGYMDERFYMLRQVRNHPVHGKALFAGFKK